MAIEQPGNAPEKSAAPISVAAPACANNPDGKIFSADELSRVAYSKMLAWKGSVLLRQRMQRLARQADDPKEQELWAQLVCRFPRGWRQLAWQAQISSKPPPWRRQSKN